MENLIISATKYTPEVNFNAENFVLELRGESYPENTAEFYAPIFTWIHSFLETLTQTSQVIVNIEIVYFNSSSSKVLMDIFDLFEERAGQGLQIQVNWIFDIENESAFEYGEEFQEDLPQLKFVLVQK